MASVSLRDLSKTFDGSARPALDHLSLEVGHGEFLVLLGPSGCGKTTALRCIAGLEEPSAGTIAIGDRDVTHLSPGARDVAMVFQNYALYPHLTVRQNIGFALEMRGVAAPEIDARVRATAERLGLGELLDRRPAQLSGGQRQRVALGRAIVRDPAVFLFDEPLSNLDAQLRVEMRAELLTLHRALGATMVFVTHDQVEAMTMGQRIALLQDGRLRQLGTPIELYQRPADVFVARFLGNPGMNAFPVRGSSLAVPLPGAEVFPATVGVRPEHVRLGPAGSGLGDAQVRMVEPLGSETLIHLEAGGVSLVAKVAGLIGQEVGKTVGVQVEPSRLHYFDAAGTRLP